LTKIKCFGQVFLFQTLSLKTTLMPNFINKNQTLNMYIFVDTQNNTLNYN